MCPSLSNGGLEETVKLISSHMMLYVYLLRFIIKLQLSMDSLCEQNHGTMCRHAAMQALGPATSSNKHVLFTDSSSL